MAGAAEVLVSIVLVHGGFVDGSGWEPVYTMLKNDGYAVSVVQNPTSSLADDVAATKRVVAGESNPVILVGHSYGGVVITEAGNDPKVAGTGLYRGLCAGSGRVRRVAHQESRAGSSGAPDPAAAGRIPAARQDQIRRVLRG